MKKRLNILVILVLSIGLQSCMKVFLWTMGVRETRIPTEEEIVKEAKRQDIPLDKIYVLETAYAQLLDSIEALDTSGLDSSQCYNPNDSIRPIKLIVKDHYQPIQAIYFKNGKMLSFHNNCNAPGMRTNWTKWGNFKSFPPKSAVPVDTLFPLNDLMKHIHPVSGNEIPSLNDSEYVVLVFWTRILRSRSRRLVKAVKENLELAGDSKVVVLYVNQDEHLYHILGDDW